MAPLLAQQMVVVHFRYSKLNHYPANGEPAFLDFVVLQIRNREESRVGEDCRRKL